MGSRIPFLCTACVAVTLFAGSADARGEDWVFRRSYFSHDDSPGYRYGIAPQPRSAYRRSYWPSRPHGYVRSGFRINNVRIYNGSNNDIEYRREFWYDVE